MPTRSIDAVQEQGTLAVEAHPLLRCMQRVAALRLARQAAHGGRPSRGGRIHGHLCGDVEGLPHHVGGDVLPVAAGTHRLRRATDNGRFPLVPEARAPRHALALPSHVLAWARARRRRHPAEEGVLVVLKALLAGPEGKMVFARSPVGGAVVGLLLNQVVAWCWGILVANLCPVDLARARRAVEARARGLEHGARLGVAAGALLFGAEGFRATRTALQWAAVEAVRASAERALPANLGTLAEVRLHGVAADIVAVVLPRRRRLLLDLFVALPIVRGVEGLQGPRRLLQRRDQAWMVHSVKLFLPGTRQYLLHLPPLRVVVQHCPLFRVVPGSRHMMHMVGVLEGVRRVPRPAHACGHAAKVRALALRPYSLPSALHRPVDDAGHVVLTGAGGDLVRAQRDLVCHGRLRGKLVSVDSLGEAVERLRFGKRAPDVVGARPRVLPGQQAAAHGRRRLEEVAGRLRAVEDSLRHGPLCDVIALGVVLTRANHVLLLPGVPHVQMGHFPCASRV
mmetsp:Transcript_154770/g.475517  ORF Transcript_154770/g.475517 Transcript_154770/m.475517 type:complete len:509 (+) Transcript_154770:14-1540(+)